MIKWMLQWRAITKCTISIIEENYMFGFRFLNQIRKKFNGQSQTREFSNITSKSKRNINPINCLTN